MKRVLIITYYWPPSGGAGVQRWLKFAKYLPEYGWKPVIFTPANPEISNEDHSLLKDIHPDTEIVQLPIWEPYSFYKGFLLEKTSEKTQPGFLSEQKKPGLQQKISIWIRGNLFIPDARKFWIRPAVRFLLNYLQHNPVDAIVSTGPPHSMHIIALKIKEKTGIPWLADFRDPWTEIDFYDQLLLTKMADKRHHFLEKKVLEYSDRVVVIGPYMKARFEEEANTNPAVIHNGYDEEDFVKKQPENNSWFSIVHVGAMNGDRNHDAFWKASRNVIDSQHLTNSQFRIRLIGKVDYTVTASVKEHGLEDYTEYIPYLPHSEIVKELFSASLLYLPINNTPNAKAIQTGKIFEYIASGRPILSIGPVDGDAASILRECNAGTMAAFSDEKTIRSVLTEHLNSYFAGKESLSKPCRQFSRRNLTQQLSQLLNEITEKRAGH